MPRFLQANTSTLSMTCTALSSLSALGLSRTTTLHVDPIAATQLGASLHSLPLYNREECCDPMINETYS